MNTSRVGISALTLICAVALQVAQGATAIEARAACEAAQAKVAEAARSVEVAKDALAKAKADKAVPPERVKELKGQLKAAEAALDENKSAAKKAIRAYEKVQADEAAAAKAKAKEEALKKAREDREAAAKAKEAEAKARAEKKAAEAKARAEENAKAKAEKARLEAERQAAKAKAEAERKAAREAEAKARAEKKAAAENARAEEKEAAMKAAEAKAAKQSAADILAAQGIAVSGDKDWFTTARARNGHTFDRFFLETLANTNLEAAAAIAQNEARESGYYLCAITAQEGKRLAIDPGRFSQIEIRFEQPNGTNSTDGATTYADEGRWFTSRQIRQKLERSMVRPGQPFNYHLLYSQFRDINSNPDLGANIELRLPKGAEANDTRAMGVDVSVKESYPLHGIVGIDNYSTDSADNWTARATLQRLNLWKAEHALTLNGFSALNGSLYGGAGSYYIPFTLGSRDAAFTLHGGYSKVDSDDVVRFIDVEGDGYFYGAQGSVELLDSVRHSLRLALGLTYRHTKDHLVLHEDGAKYPLEESGVNLLPLSLALMYSSKDLDSMMGRNYATVEGVYNVGGSNEDEFHAMRQDADKDYWLARAQLARIQTVGGTFDADKGWAGRSMVFAKLDTQYAGGALVPAEQMGVGGAASVRGYKEREFLGDHATVFTLEYRTPLYLGLVTRPTEGKSAQDRLQFVVFSDVGGIWREDVLPGEDDSQMLWGAGAGLRFAWSDYLQMRFDLGFPLKETNESETGKPAVHVSVQAQF